MSTLLILGAGGHGRVVAEIAASLGYEFSFLDDKPGENVIGKINEVEKYKNSFDLFIVAIGNNKLRCEVQKKISELGVTVAILISPKSIVSSSASIQEGTVVEPGAIINTGVQIGKGCIISVGSIIDHDSVIEDFAHVNAGAICMSGAHVEKEQKIEAGQIVHGFY